jgi:hypothetical protein
MNNNDETMGTSSGVTPELKQATHITEEGPPRYVQSELYLTALKDEGVERHRSQLEGEAVGLEMKEEPIQNLDESKFSLSPANSHYSYSRIISERRRRA